MSEKYIKCIMTYQYLFYLAAGPNQDAGMKILYGALPTPYLKVKDISYILNRASLAPCFLMGNKTPTIPASLDRRCCPLGRPDTRDRHGSEVFEVNMWAMTFARPKPRACSVQESEKRRAAMRKASGEKRRTAWESRRSHSTRGSEA